MENMFPFVWEVLHGRMIFLNAELEPGEYRIITSNRLPNGNMFTYVYYFSMAAGEKERNFTCPQTGRSGGYA